MSNTSYKQFCPVAMAAEILCQRWTIVILRELISGTTRFNDLRRGVPRMSPALLSQRLKELEEAGIVTRRRTGPRSEIFEYVLTDAGRELDPIVTAFGVWGQRWISKDVSLEHLDAQLLMWDMRRNLNTTPLPDRRCVIQFQYPEQSRNERVWWLVVEASGAVDLCSVDPGHDVDLFLSTDLRTMTSIWMGHDNVRAAVATGKVLLTGDQALAANIHAWLGLSPLASAAREAG